MVSTSRRQLLWLCLLLLSPLTQAGLPDTVEMVRPAVVGIGTVRPARQPGAKGPPSRFVGTGFAVSDGLTVVTNAHVIPTKLDTDSKETLAVFSGRGDDAHVHPAILLASDPEHDLAVLRIRPPVLPVLRLGASTAVREGQSIAFTGFPIGVVLGLYPVTHRGIVSAITPAVIPAQNAKRLSAAQLRRMRRPFDVFQLDATAYPGNSGSPVYDADTGTVIGVLNSVFVKQSKESVLESPSGISYAIPVEHLKALLATVDR